MPAPLIDLLLVMQFVGLCGIFALALTQTTFVSSARGEKGDIPPRFMTRMHLMLGGAALLYACSSFALLAAEEGTPRGINLTHTMIGLAMLSLFAALRWLHRTEGKRAHVMILGVLMQAMALAFALAGGDSMMAYVHRMLALFVIAGGWWIALDQFEPAASEKPLPDRLRLGRLGATFIICCSLLQFGAGLYLLTSHGAATNTFLSSITHASATFIASLVGAFLLIIFAFLAMALRGKRGGRAMVVVLWLTLLLVLVGMFAAKRVLRAPQPALQSPEQVASEL